MSSNQRARDSQASYDYASLSSPPRGARGVYTPSPVSPPNPRASAYDYLDQHMPAGGPQAAQRASRLSSYSQQSVAAQPQTLAEPYLPSGSGHGYPLRPPSVPSAPSYGAISAAQLPYRDTPSPLGDWWQDRRSSTAGTLQSDAAASSIALEKMGLGEEAQSATLLRKEGWSTGSPLARQHPKPGFWTRRKLLVLTLVVIAAAAGIGIGVYEATKHKGSDTGASNGSNAQNAAVSQAVVTVVPAAATTASSTTSSAAPASTSAAAAVSNVELWGGSGPVTMLNGTVFQYNNTFGGTWCAIPFNDSAQSQASAPPLSQQWDWSYDLYRGVNLGGWLVLEPFIVPSLFAPYENAAVPAVDEWTLMTNLGANASAVIEEHYATFITEIDIAQIAAAGLNWVRLPVPYWMIETYEGEPFLEGVSWTYMQQALAWCRKYGLRVELDLHTAPGSQNGLNHSGRFGSINFLMGVMGIANAQRTINYIRTLTEFITQPEYVNLVPAFMVLNEPLIQTIGIEQVRAFYYETYQMLRSIGGIGAGNGPMMVIHDGFLPQTDWAGFLQGADRLALETHDYFAFSPSTFSNSMNVDIMIPCNSWGNTMNASNANFGFTLMGEWSLAVNDCGEYILGVNQPAQYTGDCTPYMSASGLTQSMRTQFYKLFQAYQDGTRNWAFWTWKTGVSPITGEAANPLWSYSLGLTEGWIPLDPNDSVGICEVFAEEIDGGPQQTYYWVPPLAPSATGGAGSNVVAQQQAEYGVWPHSSLTTIGYAGNLPTYTPTQVPITLSASTFPASLFIAGASTNGGNGWFDASDTASYMTPIAGCSYPNPWSGVDAAVPTAPCSGPGGAYGAVTTTGASPVGVKPTTRTATTSRHGAVVTVTVQDQAGRMRRSPVRPTAAPH